MIFAFFCFLTLFASQPIKPDHENINYSFNLFQRTELDLWLAESQEPTPLVIYFHGGGFKGGDKKTINPNLLEQLLENKISVAAVNYRLTWQAPFPAQMQDAGAAIQFLRSLSGVFNLNPEQFGAIGGSAGGAISLWLGFNDDSNTRDNPRNIFPHRVSAKVQAVVAIGAQTTLDPRVISKMFDTNIIDQPLYELFGMNHHGMNSFEHIENPKFHPWFEWASPINHLNVGDAPVLLYYGQRNDPLPQNSPGHVYIHHPKFGFMLKEKMDELNIECILKLQENMENENINDHFVAFFNKHLN